MSLTGLSGVSAGLVALVAACLGYYFIGQHDINYLSDTQLMYPADLIVKLVLIGVGAIFLAIFLGVFFTIKKSRKNDYPLWTKLTRKLLIVLFIPLVVGGVFCLALIFHGQIEFVAPSTLIFYGLALIAAESYTYSDIGYLGGCEVVLGLIGVFLPGYGLLLWTVGFGVLHIIYGVLMHSKYR